jgi:hypothetical protein
LRGEKNAGFPVPTEKQFACRVQGRVSEIHMEAVDKGRIFHRIMGQNPFAPDKQVAAFYMQFPRNIYAASRVAFVSP